jgi:hypothetical protein
MRSLLLSAFVTLASSAFIISCGNNNNHDGHANMDSTSADVSTEQDQQTTTANQSVKLKTGSLDAVYQHYVHLTNALVKSDAAEARVAANAIAAGASDVTNGQEIGAAARDIAATSDIEQQRSSYAKLSDAFIKSTKNSGLQSGELYVDYCPMAMDNKGAYWLSANKEIRNPYFGDKMLECGEVKETLK